MLKTQICVTCPQCVKGPEGTNPLLTHITNDYQGQIPWAHSGQGTDVEGTAEECKE